MRPDWEIAALFVAQALNIDLTLQQQLRSGIALNAGYFRTTFGNFAVTTNRALQPTSFDPYCVTAPVDSRLPTSGQQTCGLYDLNPSKFGGQFNDDNFVTFSDHFGKRSVVFNGVDVTINARPSSRLFINGGFATGQDVDDDCDVIVDSPQKVYCHSPSGFITQVKATGSYTLPWYDINIGGVLQNLQGQEILASWSYTRAQTTLPRAFTGTTTRTVALIEPGSMFTPRRTQLDLRFAKTFRLTASRRLQVMMDMYNSLNSNAPVGANSQAGETPPGINNNYVEPSLVTGISAWQRPLNVLQGRYLKFGAQLNF